MSTDTVSSDLRRLALFAVALLVVFAAAYGVGAATSSGEQDPPAPSHTPSQSSTPNSTPNSTSNSTSEAPDEHDSH